MDVNSLYENNSSGQMAPACRIVIPKSCGLVIFGASGDLTHASWFQPSTVSSATSAAPRILCPWCCADRDGFEPFS